VHRRSFQDGAARLAKEDQRVGEVQHDEQDHGRRDGRQHGHDRLLASGFFAAGRRSEQRPEEDDHERHRDHRRDQPEGQEAAQVVGLAAPRRGRERRLRRHR
jgi:hypothetical protein